MPIIEISLKDLSNLVKKKISIEDLKKLSEYSKIEPDKVEGDAVMLEIKDSNRPDLLSAEGIARDLRGILKKETGIKQYKINPSNFVLKKDRGVKKVRPEIVCAVVKNISLDNFAIKQLIQFQEKLCEGFGRKRKEAALGVYDFDRIKWPIRYTSVKPDEIKFAPLDMDDELTPAQIIETHEKGIEYAHLLENAKEYPIIMDAEKNVLSFPPIINSNYSGKVTGDTKNLFIEVTGFNLERISQTLNIVVAALADRGGEIYSVKADGMHYPDFSSKTKSVEINDINNLIGFNLKPKEIIHILERARYNARIIKGNVERTVGSSIEINIPFYRTDIIHPVDIIEDIAIVYGYNNMIPEEPKIATNGSLLKSTKLADKTVSAFTGLEFQEIATLTLSNKEEQFKKMNIPSEEIIEIENPVSLTYSCLRKWLLPSLVNVFSQNTTKTYPQKIFEIGNIVKPNEKSDVKSDTVQKLSAAIASKNSNFTEIKQALDYFLKKFNLECSLKPVEHPSFIEGRAGEIFVGKEKIGLIGEINPKVLLNWKIEVPVSAFEIDLFKI